MHHILGKCIVAALVTILIQDMYYVFLQQSFAMQLCPSRASEILVQAVDSFSV